MDFEEKKPRMKLGVAEGAQQALHRRESHMLPILELSPDSN